MGAIAIPAPRQPSEIEKEKHSFTHIPFQSWCTARVKGKTQAELRKKIERVIESNELPTVQGDYMFMKDVTASDGLKMLMMNIKSFVRWMSQLCKLKLLMFSAARKC